jgi:hypothetical protein
MTQNSEQEKPAISFEEAMRRTHDQFDGVFKALAEFEKRERELAEKEEGISNSQASSPNE